MGHFNILLHLKYFITHPGKSGSHSLLENVRHHLNNLTYQDSLLGHHEQLTECGFGTKVTITDGAHRSEREVVGIEHAFKPEAVGHETVDETVHHGDDDENIERVGHYILYLNRILSGEVITSSSNI